MSYSILGNVGIPYAAVGYTGTSSGSVTADVLGNYTIAGLAAGTYTLTPSLVGYTFSPSNLVATVPSEIASDNFSGASLDANWTLASTLSVFSVSSGIVTGNAVAQNTAYWSGAGVFSNDQYSDVAVGSLDAASGSVGPMVRYASNNGYGVFFDSTYKIRLFGLAGLNSVFPTYTQIGTTYSGALSVGDKVRLAVAGTTLTVTLNGTPICGTPLTDTSYATGVPGIVSYLNSNNGLETWRAGNATGNTVQQNFTITNPLLSPYLAATFSSNGPTTQLFISTSSDALTWTTINGGSPVFSDAGICRDQSIIYYKGNYWIVYGVTNGATMGTTFGVASSPDLVNWTAIAHPTVTAGATQIWAPQFFFDSDGSLHVLVAVSKDNLVSTATYELHPTDLTGLTTWSSGVVLSWTAAPTTPIDSFVVLTGGTYYIFYVVANLITGVTNAVQAATASSLLGPYTTQTSGNWAGFSSNGAVEGPSLIKTSTGWQIYLDGFPGGNQGVYYYSDATSLLGSWSAIAPITQSIEMQGGTFISNPIYSISGNAGVAGATVSWTGVVGTGAVSGSVTADGSGNYTLPALANGTYTITPTKTGYTFSPTSASETITNGNIGSVGFTATNSTGVSTGNSLIATNALLSTGLLVTNYLLVNNALIPATGLINPGDE